MLIQAEYERIQKKCKERSWNCWRSGENNWKKIFLEWLPPFFTVVTKGRILFSSGYLSPQIDVLVLRPSYPPILKDRKHFLAEGVAAAFECKTTLKAEHIKEAIKTCSLIKTAEDARSGTPYKELNSNMCLRSPRTFSYLEKVTSPNLWKIFCKAINKADTEFVEHPKSTLDFLCVADLGLWHSHTNLLRRSSGATTFQSLIERYGSDGKVLSVYFRSIVW